MFLALVIASIGRTFSSILAHVFRGKFPPETLLGR